MIPTGARAAAWCARYLAQVRPGLAIAPDDGTLFLAVEGVGLGLQTLTAIMGDYVRQIGKPGACHIFRHTMATLMLDGGADIRYIQQMLGHANITSTQVYTQVSLRTLAAVHAATHPGATNQPRRHGHGNGAVLRPASSAPGAGDDGAEELRKALDAEAAEEQHDLHRPARHTRP
jgi:integrase/recombinase XerD